MSGAASADAPSLHAAVITVSDRCASGLRPDYSGPLAASLLQTHGCTIVFTTTIPDGIESVQRAVHEAVNAGARIIFTTGGTGVHPRDLTPEACEPLIARPLHGISDAIRRSGAAHTPNALLSRALVGITSHSPNPALIINAPGSTGGVKDTLEIAGPLLVHILEQMGGGDHPEPAPPR